MRTLLLLILVALPVSAGEVLFATNFDDDPNWQSCAAGHCSTGGKCFEDACPDKPLGWSFYFGRALSIEDGKLVYRTGFQNNWGNDGILSWHDLDNNYDELWVRYRFRMDGPWWTTAGGNFLKMFRISNYVGTGRNDGSCSMSQYINSPNCHRPLVYNDLTKMKGGKSTLITQWSPRCGRHNECNGTGWNNQRYPWNWSGARYCATGQCSAEECANQECGDLVRAESAALAQTPQSYSSSYQRGYTCPPDGCDTWFNYGTPGYHGDGEWHERTIHIAMNSSPNARDGVYEQWLDNTLVNAGYGVDWARDNEQVAGWNHVGFGGNNLYACDANGDKPCKWEVDDVCIATSEDALADCFQEEWVLPQDELRLCAVTRKGWLRIGTTNYCDDPLPGDIKELGVCRFARWPIFGRRLLIANECDGEFTEEIYDRMTRE